MTKRKKFEIQSQLSLLHSCITWFSRHRHLLFLRIVVIVVVVMIINIGKISFVFMLITVLQNS